MITGTEFRELMSGVCAPVAIVTTADDDGPAGATVSSFTSMSLRPPLVGVSLDRGSRLLARVQRVGRFGVNILAHAQDDLAVLFSRRDVARFGAVRWRADHGLPRLSGAAGWAVCDLHDDVETGDHRLLLGLVTHAARTAGRAPLVYADRTFGTHSRFPVRPRPLADQIAAYTR